MFRSEPRQKELLARDQRRSGVGPPNAPGGSYETLARVETDRFGLRTNALLIHI